MTGPDGAGAREPAPVAELSYSEASRELDDIVAFFEQRDVDVDQLVARLERATAIVDELDRRIRHTRMQVEELVPRLEAVAHAESTDSVTDEGRAEDRVGAEPVPAGGERDDEDDEDELFEDESFADEDLEEESELLDDGDL